MYICTKCGETFENTGYYVNVEYYGAEERLACCPHCQSPAMKAEQCQQCGEWHKKDDLIEGFCPKCEKVIQDKVKAFFEQFSEDEKDYIFESGILDEV